MDAARVFSRKRSEGPPPLLPFQPQHSQEQQQQHDYHQQQYQPQYQRPHHSLSDGSRPLNSSPRSRRRPTTRFAANTTPGVGSSSSNNRNSVSPTVMGIQDDNHHNNYIYSPDSEPSWSANPQSPGDDSGDYTNNLVGDNNGLDAETGGGGSHSVTAYSSTQQYRRSASSSVNGGGGSRHSSATSAGGIISMISNWIPPFTTLLILFSVVAGLVVAIQSRASLIHSMEQASSLIHNGHQLQDQLSTAEKSMRMLQREVSAYEAMYTGQTDNNNNNNNNPHNNNNNHNNDPKSNPSLYAHQKALEEMNQLSNRLKLSQEKADKLKQQVQLLSKKEAIQKYGDQTHRVEIELAFPDGISHQYSNNDGDTDGGNDLGPTKFVIELAPISIMPHSVHFFLEMTSAGLLDGCSFILNALHVLKAAPLPYDGSSAANKARAFTRMGLESVAFKEYDPSYPHEQYTVGFAADGSPSFYINTENNSEIHLGDPCFGRIVEGFDTVKRLEASPTRNGIWFEQRIGIKKATVLT